MLILVNDHHFLTTSIGDVFNENAEKSMTRTYLHGLVIWKVMQRNVGLHCELANKTTQQLFKYQLRALMTISVANLSKVCSQIECSYLARNGRRDFLGP